MYPNDALTPVVAMLLCSGDHSDDPVREARYRLADLETISPSDIQTSEDRNVFAKIVRDCAYALGMDEVVGSLMKFGLLAAYGQCERLAAVANDD